MPENDEEKMRQLAAVMRECEYQGLSQKEIEEREKQKQERRERNIALLNDTLALCNALENADSLKETRVFLPKEISDIKESNCIANSHYLCRFGCQNIDTLVLAGKRYEELKQSGEETKILVLNMASCKTPGGQTRNGADAQEEELCRRTSLLLSLESDVAKAYYDYGNSLNTRLGSDALIVSPHVEVIKDPSSALLSDPFEISVISCAAPMIRMGLEGMTQAEYENMLYERIKGILAVALHMGYRHLVFGAFGCGIFGNDAALVSDLFDKAFAGMPNAFETVDFAVLCKPDKNYNYQQFCKHFNK